jgi:hypothetical protein
LRYKRHREDWRVGVGWDEIGSGGRAEVPCMRDNDVVKGFAFCAEAGEANFEDH